MRSLLLLPLAAAIAACSAPPPEPEAPVRAARIEIVRPAESAAVREFVGRVEARLTTDLAFQVGGRLGDFPVSEGEILPEGALVARLEGQDFQRALRESQVQLQQARQNLAELTQSTRIILREEDGTEQLLDEEGRQRTIEETEAFIEEWC